LPAVTAAARDNIRQNQKLNIEKTKKDFERVPFRLRVSSEKKKRRVRRAWLCCSVLQQRHERGARNYFSLQVLRGLWISSLWAC